MVKSASRSKEEAKSCAKMPDKTLKISETLLFLFLGLLTGIEVTSYVEILIANVDQFINVHLCVLHISDHTDLRRQHQGPA